MVERGREEVCQGGGAFGEGLGAAGTMSVLLHMDEETTPAQVLDYLHIMYLLTDTCVYISCTEEY